MSKSKSFLPIFIPSVTVFFSSFCIMVLELVAARLIAKYLGSSLYTWTSVIGVVLAGITIGNYLGGHIADRFDARKALAVLFLISSAACVLTVIFNNLVGGIIWLWHLSWPFRVFGHVFLVFLIPSILLGTISPAVAKMALDKGLPTGRTVGDIYAWGAAGSIAGTFATGYYLIAAMGTVTIIWAVGAGLLLMAIFYWARQWVLYLWAVIFIALMTMAMAPVEWAKVKGVALALREKLDPSVIYEDESQYCYIAVKRVSKTIDKRVFIQDKLKHSEIIMGDINNLQYAYAHIYAAITHGLSQNKNKLSVLVIGGGGYVYPRYIEKNWPGSHIDVTEIDHGVTKAAMEAFGLEKDTAINIFTMDARNYVDELLERMSSGEEARRYDFIYGDAFNDYSVPYQLVTKEFNDKIAQILTDDGVYMVNLIDTFDSGQFLGSVVNTFQQTFPNVYAMSEIKPHSTRNTFVVVAAKQEIDLEKLLRQYQRGVDIWYLDDTEINAVIQNSHGIVLMDNYAPVENLMAPVVRISAKGFLALKYMEQADELRQQGKLDNALAKYKQAIRVDDSMSLIAYNSIGLILDQKGNLAGAIEAFNKAINYNETGKVKGKIGSIHLNLAIALKKSGQLQQATRHFQMAAQILQEELADEPDSAIIYERLGNTYFGMGDFNQAAKYFQKAVDLNPYDIAYHRALAKALEYQGKYDQAILALKKAGMFMSHMGQKADAAELQRLLELVEAEKSKYQK